MKIITKQFVLRPLRLADLENYVKYGSNKKISRNMLRLPFPLTRPYVKERINRSLREYKKSRPVFYNLAVEINGEFCGWISLNQMDWGHKATIGYWLAEKHWGQGYMTKIVRLVTAWGFKKFKLRRIEATTFIFNPASASVLTRAGYTHEGLLKKYYCKKGKYLDVNLFAKIK